MNTHDSLVAEFRALGLRADMIVMTHSSLRAMGWTEGGAETVVRAILSVLQAMELHFDIRKRLISERTVQRSVQREHERSVRVLLER